MKNNTKIKGPALIVLTVPILFFALGFKYPLLQTGYGIRPFTWRSDSIYPGTSFR